MTWSENLAFVVYLHGSLLFNQQKLKHNKNALSETITHSVLKLHNVLFDHKDSKTSLEKHKYDLLLSCYWIWAEP